MTWYVGAELFTRETGRGKLWLRIKVPRLSAHDHDRLSIADQTAMRIWPLVATIKYLDEARGVHCFLLLSGVWLW